MSLLSRAASCRCFVDYFSILKNEKFMSYKATIEAIGVRADIEKNETIYETFLYLMLCTEVVFFCPSVSFSHLYPFSVARKRISGRKNS